MGVGGISQATANLSTIYSQVNSKLSDSLSKIASGKRTYNPTDDFTSYLKASTINAEQVSLQRNKESIATAKEVTSGGVKLGQQVLEQLAKLKDLTATYADANTSAEAKVNIKAQGDAIKTSLDTMIAGAKAGTTALDGAVVAGGGVTFGAASIGALTTDVSAGSATVDADIATVTTYLSQMQSQNDMLTDLNELNDTVDMAKSNTLSAVQDVNDVKELAKVTDLQVRASASVAMMAQANSTRAGIARLF